MEAGALGSAQLLAAWTSDGGQHWSVSPVTSLASAYVVSASFGPNGAVAVTLSNGRGQLVAGPGAGWQPLPAMPPGRAVTLALPPGGGTEALAASGSTLTVWTLTGSPAKWAKAQSMTVPIQYGSSSSGS
jgi:hypothetical protein